MAWRLSIAMVILVGSALDARADAKKAIQLFDEGQALKKAGDLVKACAKFEQALTEDATAVGVALNVADCKERAGKTASAWRQFQSLVTVLESKRDPRSKYARERVEALEPMLSKIVVTLTPSPAPPGTTVEIDRVPVTVTNEMIEIRDPGPYEIVVTSPGRSTIKRQGTLGPKDIKTEAFELVAVSVAPSPPPPAPEPATRRSRGRVRLALGLGGGGVVLVGATAVISVLAKSRYDDAIGSPECTREPLVCTEAGTTEVDRARSLARIGTFTGIAGAGLLVASGVLYVTAPRERLVVGPGPGSVGLAVLGRF